MSIAFMNNKYFYLELVRRKKTQQKVYGENANLCQLDLIPKFLPFPRVFRSDSIAW